MQRLVVFAYLFIGLLIARPALRADEILFARDIQPILAKHCFACHGPDKQEADLRLDTSAGASAAVSSGDVATSTLFERITTTDESERMPPESKPLSQREVDLLKQWIENGAAYDNHWAYRPIQAPAVPETLVPAGGNNIDRFILAQLADADIESSAVAARETLIKRLSYDLIGLPPTPSDVDAFLKDSSASAYEALVDRLLASNHYGERWGRHWLDKARYADSDGYEKDNPRPNAWRYRDWVIDAINSDLPYDQFSIEQLAGDLLDKATPAERLATAFHRQTLTNTEGGTDQEEFRVEATFDRTETVVAIWMGLTMTCARCHTHKYDQITQHEYYQTFSTLR